MGANLPGEEELVVRLRRNGIQPGNHSVHIDEKPEKRESGSLKATFELPEDLLRGMKVKAARDWFASLAEPDMITFCRATQTTFLRMLTRRIAEEYIPITNDEAWGIYRQIQSDDAVSFVREPDGLEITWSKLSSRGTPSPKVWMDAYLAAFALAGQLQLVTFDADFEQYKSKGLRVVRLGV